jgi:hypothetical protein
MQGDLLQLEEALWCLHGSVKARMHHSGSGVLILESIGQPPSNKVTLFQHV